ncbi:hypothetical protein BpHYR1_015563 [Brachionus plicatilis]|uniref:Uncharacterized protein n=1 Tax=Brachionus plicatilis TaxID=10195 RepID=A0A3M7S4T4_BRAPC|nr:hypothetical protein BpHYR1_015563 [Brachionus plicatilis]
MTMANTNTVASKLALTLSLRVANRWNRAIMAPSNSVPRPALMVAGLNAFHTIVSQIFVAMNSEMPEPRP